MKRTRIMLWSFAAAAAVSLAFGTAQAFAAPGAQTAKSWCEEPSCRLMCGTGCGGTCINNECYCDC
ncbi:MAG TPA: hypothetical protein VFY65_14555 [Longimicrobium sp.]|nr:hypothetical protein [Longimicrobium sp.]